jgi:DNA-binding FadR family transcriptional regulator
MSGSAATVLADRIESDVRASKAPPGALIASEQELRSLHSAGRSVFRQAVRILEERGVAYTRRGVGGGLVIGEARGAFEGRALSILLESQIRSYEHLALLPKVLNTHLYLYSASKIDLETCRSLRRLSLRLEALPDDEFLRVGGYRQLHTAIDTASGEPAVALLHWATTETVIDLMSYSFDVVAEATRGAHWRLTRQTVEALTAGDTPALFECRRQQQQMFETHWSNWEGVERDPGLAPRLDDPRRPEFHSVSNRAERLAREILREIRRRDWRVGERIGGGAELMERYGASADILRQAVRTLEEHSVVVMERGRKGGLFVGEPNIAVTIERSTAFLERAGADPADIRALLVNLILEVLDQSVPAQAKQIEAALGALLQTRPGDGEPLNFADICQAIAYGSGNPAARLAVDILTPIAPVGSVERSDLAAMRRAVADHDLAWSRRVFLQYARQAPVPC